MPIRPSCSPSIATMWHDLRAMPSRQIWCCRLTSSFINLQVARKGAFDIHELAAYFDLPIEDAAKQLSICPTLLKRICRRHGISRWPYRKVSHILLQCHKVIKTFRLQSISNQNAVPQLQGMSRLVDKLELLLREDKSNAQGYKSNSLKQSRALSCFSA